MTAVGVGQNWHLPHHKEAIETGLVGKAISDTEGVFVDGFHWFKQEEGEKWKGG